MTALMVRQVQELVVMFCGGCAVMLVLMTKDCLCQQRDYSRRVRICLSLFFWLAAGYLFCQFLYVAAYGRLSMTTLAAFSGGCILWKKKFCGILSLYRHAQNRDGDTKDEEKNKRESKSF